MINLTADGVILAHLHIKGPKTWEQLRDELVPKGWKAEELEVAWKKLLRHGQIAEERETGVARFVSLDIQN